MFKLIEFDRFRPDGMEVIFPIDLDRPLRKQAACSKHVKIAEPVRQFCDSVEAHPKRAFFLNVALGAGETWGMNKNGDWFPRDELAVEAPAHGHTTFLKAGRYRHHVNKDPAKSLGKVCYAHWNTGMDRVELVSWIDRDRAPDVAERIDNLEKTGEDIGTSMGCKVPYDICSVCHHKAAIAKNYCSHLKTAMGRILPGGKAVYAHNVRPFFFDDSFVILKAANEAGVTMKVASAAGRQDRPGPIIVSSALLGLEFYGEDKEADDKSAGPKSSAIKKEIPGQIEPLSPEDEARIAGGRKLMDDLAPVVEGCQEPLPGEKISQLARFPIDKVAATSAFMGIVLTPGEFQKLALCSSGDRGALWANALEADGVVFDPNSDQVLDWEEKQAEVSPFSIDDVDEKVAEILMPMAPARSYWEPHASRRFEKWAGFGVARRVERAVELVKRANAADYASLLPIALGYALYRMQLGRQTPGRIDKFVTSRPAIAIPLLGGLAAGGLAMLQPPPGMGPEIADMPRLANEKMAGIGTRYVLPFFAPYVYSAELKREERQRGYPHQGFKGFAKEHPGVLGLLSVGAAGTLANKYKAVAQAARKLTKTGAAGGTQRPATSVVADATKMVASGLYKARHFPGALLDELVLSKILHASGAKG